jgi:hypothetical protein
VPGEAPPDKLEVEVGGAHENPRDEPAVLVDVDWYHVDVPLEDERGRHLLGCAAEGLAELGGVDAVEPQRRRARRRGGAVAM